MNDIETNPVAPHVPAPVAAEAPMQRRGEGPDRWSGLTGGIVLIVIGVAFLLARMDFLDRRDFWRYAPLVLVGLGVARLIEARSWPQLRSGMNLTLVGGWMLINTLGVGDFHWGNSWPLLLIGFGLIAVLQVVFRSRFADRQGRNGDAC